ncbi:MAG: ATP-binding protein [Actinobacteria bacterium]|nr:ATP-binding protein [Cyanobacteriota bacterium]MCL5771946.1 ATP-binding protein [Actinomycetota bacterium]
MGQYIKRILNIDTRYSSFLWGARRTGKTYWINHNFKPEDIIFIDLLQTDVFAEYASRPSLLRERFQNTKKLIVIDEIQKVPMLLDEIHWMIENKQITFLLTGSSARKLRRSHVNLLAGRALRYQLMPFSFIEVGDIDLEKVMVSGMLPPHFLSPKPIDLIRSYVADYLKEEIAQEAQIQRIPQFSEFLRVAALTSGELLNYSNVARETGVSSKIVRSYFDILEATMLGFRVSSWKASKTRRLLQAEKFYLFDVGLSNYLAKRQPKEGTPEFGKSFEHLILMELQAYKSYKNPELDITYWRTSTGYEVDFILGDKDVALEIKSGRMVYDIDLKSLKALQEDGKVKNLIIVSQEKYPREIGEIKIIPWRLFLEKLWAGEFGI